MTAELAEAVSRIRRREKDAPPGIVLAVETPAGRFAVVDGARELAGSRPGTTRDLPMTIDTHHDVASVTKAIATTTAIMRLVDSLELSLDLPVRAVLPSAALSERTTVRELLQHRAGLWEWWPLYFGTRSPDEAYEVLDHLPLRYEPGAGRHYSDLGFMLLGRVIERVCGATLPAAVQALVLDPLGLSSTGYGHPLDGDVAASSAGDEVERQMIETGVPYPVPFRPGEFSRWRNQVLVGDVNDGNAFHAFDGISGHAGLFSTVGDLLAAGHRLAAPYDDDGFVSGAVRCQFFAEGPDSGQALGFRRYAMHTAEGVVDVIGHPGFTGVTIGWLPEAGTSIVLATNRLHRVGTPVPNDRMWTAALEGVSALLDRLGLRHRLAAGFDGVVDERPGNPQ